MKYFNIPGVYDHRALNDFLLSLMQTNPEFFYPDVKISSIFGNFHFCIWDGGRNFYRYNQSTEEEILATKALYEHYQVPIRFVFTNPALKEEHLYNRFCNLLLEIFHTGKNEVVVNSSLLLNYIKTNYPNYKLISSTTKRITNQEECIKELSNKDYFQVCLDYDLNKKNDFIESIPKELRQKCEFLINAICPPNCPSRKMHYYNNGLAQLTYLKHHYIHPQCGIKDGLNYKSVLGQGNNFSLQDLDDYSKMGFKYFKIEGRTLPSFEILLQYCYYFIKPEYYWEVLSLASSIEGIFINSPNAEQFYQKIDSRFYNISL